MKKIGYIYKYCKCEGFGILVFGTWKVKRRMCPTVIKNTPILFSNNDLLSDIRTGQLVYFDFDGHTASNIERASLSNFDLELVNSLIRCGVDELESSFYYDNTIISFENLGNIILPAVEKSKTEFIDDETPHWRHFYVEPYDDVIPEIDFDPLALDKNTNDLPESIKELYNCFGKYKHEGKESTALTMLDLSLWMDVDTLGAEYYGQTVDELKYLYDIFVLRKHYDKKGSEINDMVDNDCISSAWSLLLSKLKESDLVSILQAAPKLQPALPMEFCKKNISILSDNYGMPSVEICRLYCKNKISTINTYSEYKDFACHLSAYYSCSARHLEGEGVPMCQMGRRRIGYLMGMLEKRYQDTIKPNIISQIVELCQDTSIEESLENVQENVFKNVAIFLENYICLREVFYFRLGKSVVEGYNKLPVYYQEAFECLMVKLANEDIVIYAKKNESIPLWLSRCEEHLKDWVSDSTKKYIRELVNEKYSELDDIDDLYVAYEADYISSEQFLSRYKELTCDFDIDDLREQLSKHEIQQSSIEVQWYIIQNIIKQLQNNIQNYKYDINSIICNVIKWIQSYCSCDNKFYQEMEDEVCSVLSADVRWMWFKNNIVKSPGLENKHLLQAVKSIVPLSTTMNEDISALKKWASTRARFASDKPTITDDFIKPIKDFVE